MGIQIIKLCVEGESKVEQRGGGGQRVKERKTENEQGKIRRENEKCA